MVCVGLAAARNGDASGRARVGGKLWRDGGAEPEAGVVAGARPSRHDHERPDEAPAVARRLHLRRLVQCRLQPGRAFNPQFLHKIHHHTCESGKNRFITLADRLQWCIDALGGGLQVAQVLLTLPYSFAQLGYASGIVFQLFYGVIGCWSCYMITWLYVEYRTRKEREGVIFKNHVIQVCKLASNCNHYSRIASRRLHAFLPFAVVRGTGWITWQVLEDSRARIQLHLPSLRCRHSAHCLCQVITMIIRFLKN